MTDYQKLRDLMVETQLVPRGIRDKAVLDAMRNVPRHYFVDSALQYSAYDDMALPIGEGQTISQPYMVAIMTELLALTGRERVLEIGTGSGYQAAILGMLSREVFTIERIATLTEKAMQRFRELSYLNIYARTGDGTLGWPEKAPFDRIIITAASPKIPDPLKEQLSDNGIIVVPVGSRYSQQLLRITKTRSGYEEEYHTPCVFVPLIGEHGWKE
ncbi:L-isoaspartate protein carboxylmethyltransferase type II [Candidatus Sulfobium mesophilum]|uniref:Protein-L-isoaspartate O-methyltransferase n=1 Tax=Candidatus Sulfobium mesophilum TaxID=2016548 RepID=A0A2U3QFS6_9BACT|nr:L-isoaspartate protein carboxylmethyltransferase type II [Candidatus Sulfobium mesophilum]